MACTNYSQDKLQQRHSLIYYRPLPSPTLRPVGSVRHYTASQLSRAPVTRHLLNNATPAALLLHSVHGLEPLEANAHFTAPSSRFISSVASIASSFSCLSLSSSHVLVQLSRDGCVPSFLSDWRCERRVRRRLLHGCSVASRPSVAVCLQLPALPQLPSLLTFSSAVLQLARLRPAISVRRLQHILGWAAVAFVPAGSIGRLASKPAAAHAIPIGHSILLACHVRPYPTCQKQRPP